MIDFLNPETLILERDGGWLTIWFNTPENRNALSEKLAEELSKTLLAAKENPAIRGITLRGKGGVFCAGGDLRAFHAALQNGPSIKEQLEQMNRGAGELLLLVSTMPQVVVVLVEGAAIAGGLGLVCCADIVIVTKVAKFSLTETQLGIPPAQIAPYVVRRVGIPTARKLMLTGSRFNGEDAHGIGIADYAVDDTMSLESIEAAIRKDVMQCAPGANAAAKEIVLTTQLLDQNDMMDFAAKKFASCLLSDEGREGISAFIEKRKPKWAMTGE